MAETKRRLTWHDVKRMARRPLYRYLFVLGASLFAIVALIGAQCMPLKYTGTATFDLRMDPASEDISGSRTTSVSAIQSTLVNDVRRREYVASAARELGLMDQEDEFPRGPEQQLTLKGRMAEQKLVARLQDSIRVDFLTREEGIRYRVVISFTGKDPDLAEKMPNTLLENYKDRKIKEIHDDLQSSFNILKEKVGDADTRLKGAIKRRIEFEAKYGGMLPDSPGALQERMQQMSTDMDTVRRQGAVAKQTFERLKALAEKAAAAPGEPIQIVKGPNPELDLLKKDLRTFEEQLANARILAHMKDKHPTVQALSDKIEKIKKKIEETPEKIVLQEYYGSEGPNDNIKTALAAAQSEVEMDDKELERLQERVNAVQLLVANYAPVRQQYLELSKNVEELDAKKKSWQDRLTGVQMALESEVADRRTHLEAVQLAEKQFLPSSPKLLYVLGFALAGGLAFGGGLVFLVERLHHSVFTTQEADAHFNLPVCGVIGEIVTPWQRRGRKVRRWLLEPVGGLILLAIVGFVSLNIVLWLRHPEEHQEWKSDPVGFVVDGAHKVVDKVESKLREEL